MGQEKRRSCNKKILELKGRFVYNQRQPGKEGKRSLNTVGLGHHEEGKEGNNRFGGVGGKMGVHPRRKGEGVINGTEE